MELKVPSAEDLKIEVVPPERRETSFACIKFAFKALSSEELSGR